MRRFSPAQVVAALTSIFLLNLLGGCSGTSTSTPQVSTVVLAPSTLSLNPGQVVALSASAKNSSGAIVVADITFSSANTSIVTISPGGLVCAGVWDANYITCSPVPGQAGIGQTVITAASGSVTATATAYTHLKADSVVVNPPAGCYSVAATPTFTATVYSTTAPECSQTNPCDITSTVGPITYTSTDLTVMANGTTTGVLTALQPGATHVFATVSGLNSVPQTTVVCAVASIKIHDASSTNTSFTLSKGGTQALAADVIDTAGVAIKPNLTWSSIPQGSATISGGAGTNSSTITSVAPGTAIITATCSTPDCNKNLPAQHSLNVVTATTSGSSSTTVYAASTNSTTLIPITTPGNAAGTAITLPQVPNSMMTDSAGINLFLGSGSQLMSVNTSTGAVTTYPVIGQVIAVSPNGADVLLSDAVNNVVTLYNIGTKATVVTHPVTTASGTFTPDSKSASFITGQQLYFDTATPTTTVTNLGYTPTALDVSAQGGLIYLSSNAGKLIDVRSSCNQSELQSLAAVGPTLLAHLPSGSGAVVVDAPAIDLVTTGTIGPGCPVTTPSTLNTYDLGAGSFNPRQLFLSSDSTRAWIVSDLTSLINFNLTTLTAAAVPLTGGVQAYSGGVTLDGSAVYVGTSDNTVHVINVASQVDAGPITVGLKDGSGNAVAPNLVVVLPH